MISIYRPLVGDEVRFIRIQPGAWTDPIRCDLVYQSLPNTRVDPVDAWLSDISSSTTVTPGISNPIEKPTYVALSYVWGDASVTEELMLNGKPVQKTANLIAGLRQLRVLLENPSRAPKTFDNHDVMFWIDALCIDQDNVEEKSMQVPRMGTIYSSAAVVVAWLGENGAEDEKIRDLMSLANTLCSRENSPQYELDDTMLKTLGSDRPSDMVLTLQHLCQRPWFDRVWIVQEMVRSRRPALLAGSYWCHYLHLEAVWIGIYKLHSCQPWFVRSS
ncbi:hypothetical protein G6011_05086 [Alternaria panax]|uniref:Heterokaryon incompatibility domain-containing protein n=1 Tax=Alternaria panax TaxID=48097 RepID=A0AAD4I370_9PLEO|nr:hypothetical protein G6011_05086 [Alternaria panax]